NVFIKNYIVVITSTLIRSIIHRVTRYSVIQLLKHWGVPVTERRISIDELYDLHKEGKVEEIFSAGTAAVISPIGQLTWKGQDMVVNNYEIGDLTQKVYNTLTGIQYGTEEDIFNWTITLD